MEDSPSKPSVAELAGRFKGHTLPTPNDQLLFRRKPPCSLKLRNPPDGNEESAKSPVFPAPSKIKVKNSAIIEKLQANLALSPTALLPSPKSPEVKLQPAPLSPAAPCSPLSPLSPSQQQASHLSSEDEEPAVGFESPPEGALLPSINKTRARLSFKRRPPTRQHRRSAGDEAGGFGGGSGLSPSELCSTKENGDGDQVFDCPGGDAHGGGQPGSAKAGDSKDCEKTEVTKGGDLEEEEEEEGGPQPEAEEAQSSEPLEEKRLPSQPAEQLEGVDEAEEAQEEMLQEENNRM